MGESPRPLKRSPSLQPLSRQHHDGLMLCFKIRQAVSAGVAPARLTAFIHWFAKEHLEPHFEAEENFLLPLLPEDDPLVIRTVEEHRRLRSYFEKPEFSGEDLECFAGLLDDHIRFEERILFDTIQKTVDEQFLLKALSKLEAEEACVNWSGMNLMDR